MEQTDAFQSADNTIGAQIEEVIRELQMRRRVYPRLIGAGKLTTSEARRQTARLEHVGVTLMQVRRGDLVLHLNASDDARIQEECLREIRRRVEGRA